MPTEMLNKDENRVSLPLPPRALLEEKSRLRVAASRHAKRVHRLKIKVVAWVLGSTLITVLWVANQWQANGAFQHFGSHQGNPGDWNPTLWALVVGIWGLIVGIAALRVHFERPGQPERSGRLKFHVSAWILGMVVLTPLWALIEWQDNGGFERWSGNGQPGSWEPWILYVAGVWALVIALLTSWAYVARSLKGGPSGGRS